MRNILLLCSSIASLFIMSISYGSALHRQTLKLEEPCRIGLETVKVSPDGSLLAVVCNDDYRDLTTDYSLAIYDLKGLKELSRTIFSEESVFLAPNFYPEFTPDSSAVIVLADREREIGINRFSTLAPFDYKYSPLSHDDKVLKGIVTANHIAADGTIYFGLGRYGEGPSLFSVNPDDFAVERIFTDKPSSVRGEDVKAIVSTNDLVVSMSQDKYLRIHQRSKPNYGQKSLLDSATGPFDLAKLDETIFLGAYQSLSEHELINGKELSHVSYDYQGPGRLLPRPKANIFMVLGKDSSIHIRALDNKSILLDTSDLPEYSGLFLPYVPVVDLAEDGSVLAVKTRDSLLVSYLNQYN